MNHIVEARRRRWREVLRMRDDEHLTFRSIGAHYGVGPQQGRLLYWQAKRALLRKPRFSDDLSARAQNILNNANLQSREEVKEAIRKGTLRPGTGGTRNYGIGTHIEVCEWLGLPAPAKVLKPVYCPHCGKDIRNVNA